MMVVVVVVVKVMEVAVVCCMLVVEVVGGVLDVVQCCGLAMVVVSFIPTVYCPSPPDSLPPHIPLPPLFLSA